eukprot:scaffold32800_cov57-Phaeocystis_antarctica.AAC.1
MIATLLFSAGPWGRLSRRRVTEWSSWGTQVPITTLTEWAGPISQGVTSVAPGPKGAQNGYARAPVSSRASTSCVPAMTSTARLASPFSATRRARVWRCRLPNSTPELTRS